MLGGAGWHRDEYGCDFPRCGEDFDQAKGAKAAILKGDNVLAFCASHSHRLSSEGVKLRTLAEIHAEQKEAKDAPMRFLMRQDQDAREKAFIQSLK